ncbi:YslB family protein [Isobaculum melis]|uniref:DUF2507 domain-containing protein n=1 Tax=Isobaculum melis TaxID=142588 RepID=A0A1H9RKV3_9LACT|nr:YslB family protein [Isobaculum melis]SER72579.1 Protein of unknown function [Isobaculum melis]
MEKKQPAVNQEEETITLLGYEMIRDILIPNILGKDTDDILYWAGKELARKFPLSTIEDMLIFFKNASFGHLTFEKEKKNQMQFILSGSLVSARFKASTDPSFKLEAGFIAEQLQMQTSRYTEATEEIDYKKQLILITAQWDEKDTAPVDQPDTFIKLD